MCAQLSRDCWLKGAKIGIVSPDWRKGGNASLIVRITSERNYNCAEDTGGHRLWEDIDDQQVTACHQIPNPIRISLLEFLATNWAICSGFTEPKPLPGANPEHG